MTAQQHGVTKGRRILFGGKIEMPEPQLFVGERKELVNRAAAALRHLHVEAAGEVQCADLLLPDKIQPVVAPAAGNFDDQLLLAGAVMRPVVGDDDLLDKVNRVSGETASVRQLRRMSSSPPRAARQERHAIKLPMCEQ